MRRDLDKKTKRKTDALKQKVAAGKKEKKKEERGPGKVESWSEGLEKIWEQELDEKTKKRFDCQEKDEKERLREKE